MRKRRKGLKNFIKAINKFSEGKSPKGFKCYEIDKKGNKREILNKLKLNKKM